MRLPLSGKEDGSPCTSNSEMLFIFFDTLKGFSFPFTGEVNGVLYPVVVREESRRRDRSPLVVEVPE